MKLFSISIQVKIFTVSLLATHLVACQPNSSTDKATGVSVPVVEPKGDEIPPTNPPVVKTASGVVLEVQKKVELREDRANIEEFKQNLNQYVVTIKIPEELFVEDIQIVGSQNPLALNPKYTYLPKHKATYQDGVYHITETFNLWQKDFKSKKITYKIITQDKTLEEMSFELYPDLVVKAAQNQPLSLASIGILSGHYRFGVLFLEKGSVLSTQGASVKLQVQRLYVDDAKIESFSDEEANTFPSYGEAGRSGGHLVIQSDFAIGRLTVEMRGTTGGKGYPALIQDKTAKVRTRGADGAVEHYCDAPVVKPAPSGARTLRNRRLGGCGVICLRDPQDGLPGDNGFDGFDGNKGGVGGSSGFVEVHVANPAPDFQVQVFHFPGKGGLGSPGSPGTPGTPGGLAGEDFGICRKARTGVPGLNGKNGVNGANGAPGATEVSHITIAGQKVL